MALEIQTIQGALRTAAENADKTGTKSYNGYLDQEEISAFIKNGVDTGCSMADVIEVATKVVSKDDPIIQQAINDYNANTDKINLKKTKEKEIAELEDKIETLAKELENKNEEKEEIWQTERWRKPSKETKESLISGSIPGVIIGGVLGKFLPGASKNLALKVLAITSGALVGAVASALYSFSLFKSSVEREKELDRRYGITGPDDYGDYSLFNKEKNIPENYQDSVQFNRAEQFKQEQIIPLEQQLSKLISELEAKKAEVEQL